MSGKRYFTWGQSQLAFLRAHVGRDMTPREIAGHYGCTEELGHRGMRQLTHRYGLSQLTALHTPGGGRAIGRDIPKATYADAYQPMSLSEFHALYPDGLRPEGPQRHQGRGFCF